MSIVYHHRLVMRTPALRWGIPLDIAVDGIRIRFEHRVAGGRIGPNPCQGIEAARPGSGYRHGDVTHNGHFVEVICAGRDPDAAELRAHAAMGFVAFCVGDQVVGDAVFSEAYQGDPDGRYLVRSATTSVDISASLDRPLINTMVACLPRITASIGEGDALALALRWYGHGAGRTSALDRVISYFVGIEAILKAHAARVKLRSRLAPLAADPLFRAQVQRYADSMGRGAIDRLVSGLVAPTNAERFASYAEHHRLDEELRARFARLSRLRNRAMHSSAVAATEGDARSAQDLLRTIIKLELRLVGVMRTDLAPGRSWETVRWSDPEEPGADLGPQPSREPPYRT